MGVQILDCTLRDGGYVNNWEFGRHAIASILDKLEAGGVEIVECGFLTSRPRDEDCSLYGGADDLTLYTPKFDSELTYSCPAYGFTRTGPFETSVCFPERVAQQDWFNGNPYTYYAGGDYPIATITNHKNPDGPRVVLLRDSFACALTPFLALSCSELTTIDLRYFEGDLLDTIAGLEPDIALTLYTASTTRLDNLFQYEHTEE